MAGYCDLFLSRAVIRMPLIKYDKWNLRITKNTENIYFSLYEN